MLFVERFQREQHNELFFQQPDSEFLFRKPKLIFIVISVTRAKIARSNGTFILSCLLSLIFILS